MPRSAGDIRQGGQIDLTLTLQARQVQASLAQTAEQWGALPTRPSQAISETKINASPIFRRGYWGRPARGAPSRESAGRERTPASPHRTLHSDHARRQRESNGPWTRPTLLVWRCQATQQPPSCPQYAAAGRAAHRHRSPEQKTYSASVVPVLPATHALIATPGSA
jgi:hypothetical protein